MRAGLAAIGLVAALSGCATVPAQRTPVGPAAEPVRINLIAFNDFHGNLQPPRQAIAAPGSAGADVQVPAGIFDALADLVARAIACFQRGGQQRAQRRIAAQRLDMARIELAARSPVAHFLAQPGGQDFIAAQGPETLQDNCQSQYAQQQQRQHRPATGLDQFPHVSILRPSGRLFDRR